MTLGTRNLRIFEKNEFFLHKIRGHLFLHTYIGIFMVSIGHYGGSLLTLFLIFENSHFWPFGGHFWVKIDPKIDIFTQLSAFCSGRVQDGF